MIRLSLPIRTPGAAALGAAALLLFTFCFGGAGAALAPPREPSTVAVVDLHRVLTAAKPFVAGDAAIRTWIEEQRVGIRRAREALESKKAEIDAFAPGSDERARLELEVAKATLDLDFAVADADRERERRIVDHQRKSFDRATEVIQGLARDQHIDLVLQLRSGPLRAEVLNELSSEIFLREVLAADAELDITADVLSILDR